MQSKNAVGNLINRYRAVLKKCNLLNTFGSLAIVGTLTTGVGLAMPMFNISSFVDTAHAASVTTTSGAGYIIEEVASGSTKTYFKEFSVNHGSGTTTYGILFKGTDYATDPTKTYSSIDKLVVDMITAQKSAVPVGAAHYFKEIVEVDSSSGEPASGTYTFTVKSKDENGDDVTLYFAVKNASGGLIKSTNNRTTKPDAQIFDNFIANSADEGGAIENASNATIDAITASSFIGNNANTKGGGAIYNTEIIDAITASSFTGNNANTYGGAIYNIFGTIGAITASSFIGNSSTNGGAIYNIFATIGAITASSFIGNSANTDCGAIMNFATINAITASSFTGNNANTKGGGAIYNTNTINAITASSFTGNNANTYGGAIYNDSTIEAITASSFIGNSANSIGGAIYNTNTINFIAATAETGGLTLFRGNTAYNDVSNAISNEGTVNFNAGVFSDNNKGIINMGIIDVQDYISKVRVGSGTININGTVTDKDGQSMSAPTNGLVMLNKVSDNNLTLHAGALSFADGLAEQEFSSGTFNTELGSVLYLDADLNGGTKVDSIRGSSGAVAGAVAFRIMSDDADNSETIDIFTGTTSMNGTYATAYTNDYSYSYASGKFTRSGAENANNGLESAINATAGSTRTFSLTSDYTGAGGTFDDAGTLTLFGNVKDALADSPIADSNKKYGTDLYNLGARISVDNADANLNVIDMSITNAGTAITNTSGNVMVYNSVFSGNATALNNNSKAFIFNTTFSANTARAINNTGTLQLSNVNFVNNSNTEKGAAIYSTGDITLQAQAGDYKISGNTLTTGENINNAIYLEGENKSLTFQLDAGASYTLDDNVQASSAYTVNVKGSGVLNLNNALMGASAVNVTNTTLNLGTVTHGGLDFYGSLDTAALTVTNGTMNIGVDATIQGAVNLTSSSLNLQSGKNLTLSASLTADKGSSIDISGANMSAQLNSFGTMNFSADVGSQFNYTLNIADFTATSGSTLTLTGAGGVVVDDTLSTLKTEIATDIFANSSLASIINLAAYKTPDNATLSEVKNFIQAHTDTIGAGDLTHPGETVFAAIRAGDSTVSGADVELVLTGKGNNTTLAQGTMTVSDGASLTLGVADSPTNIELNYKGNIDVQNSDLTVAHVNIVMNDYTVDLNSNSSLILKNGARLVVDDVENTSGNAKIAIGLVGDADSESLLYFTGNKTFSSASDLVAEETDGKYAVGLYGRLYVEGTATFSAGGDIAMAKNASLTATGLNFVAPATLKGGNFELINDYTGTQSLKGALTVDDADSTIRFESGAWTTDSPLTVTNGTLSIETGTLTAGADIDFESGGTLVIVSGGKLDITGQTLTANLSNFGTVDTTGHDGTFIENTGEALVVQTDLTGGTGTKLVLNTNTSGTIWLDNYNVLVNNIETALFGSLDEATVSINGYAQYQYLTGIDTATNEPDNPIAAGDYKINATSTFGGIDYDDRHDEYDSTISGGGELNLTGNTGQERVLSVGSITVTNGYLNLGYDAINGTDGGTVQGDLIVDEASTKTASANIYGTTVTVDGAAKALSGGVITVDDDSTFTAASLEVNGAGSKFYSSENVSIIGSLTVANGGDLDIASGIAVNVGGVASIGGIHDFAAGTVNAKGGFTVSSELILTNANLTSEANLTGAKINLGDDSTLKLAGTKGGSIAQEVVATIGGIDVAGGTWTANGNISVTGAGSLKVTGGTLDVSGADLTLSASTTAFSTASGATLKAKGDDFLAVDASTGTISKATTLGTALKNDGTLALTGLDILFGADATRSEKVQMESKLQTAGILAAGSVGTVDYIGVDFDGLYSLSFVDEGDTAFQNETQNIMAGTLSGTGNRIVNAAGIVENTDSTPAGTASVIEVNQTLNLSGNNANNVLLDQGALTNNGTLNLGASGASYTSNFNGDLTTSGTTNVLSAVNITGVTAVNGGSLVVNAAGNTVVTSNVNVASGAGLTVTTGTLDVSNGTLTVANDASTTFATGADGTLKAKVSDFGDLTQAGGFIKNGSVEKQLTNAGTLILANVGFDSMSKAANAKLRADTNWIGLISGNGDVILQNNGQNVALTGLYSLEWLVNNSKATEAVMAGVMNNSVANTASFYGIVANTDTNFAGISVIEASDTISLTGQGNVLYATDAGTGIENKGTLNLGSAGLASAVFDGTLTTQSGGTTNVLSSITYTDAVTVDGGGTFNLTGGNADFSEIVFTADNGATLKTALGTTLTASIDTIGVNASGVGPAGSGTVVGQTSTNVLGKVVIAGLNAQTLGVNDAKTLSDKAKASYGDNVNVIFNNITYDNSIKLSDIGEQGLVGFGETTVDVGNGLDAGETAIVGGISGTSDITLSNNSKLSITGDGAANNVLYKGTIKAETGSTLITGKGTIAKVENTGGTVKIEGETKVETFTQSGGTSEITSGKLIVENLTITTGGMNVGNGNSKGEVIAQNVEGKGNIIFHDPAWSGSDELSGASTGVYKNFVSGEVDAKLVAGQNSYVVIGDSSSAWAQTSFKNSGLEWSSSKITAALFINEAQTLAANGAIEVNGAFTSSTQTTVTGNDAKFADNSLLVVNASNIGTSAALSATTGTLTVDAGANLVISGGAGGQVVTVVDGFTTASVADNSWGKGETYDAQNSRYATLMTDSRAVGIDDTTTTFLTGGTFVVGLKALQVELPKVNQSVNNFLTEAGNANLDGERQLFVDYVNNVNTDSNQAGATIQGTVQAVQTAGVAATGADVGNAVAQTLASRTNMSALGIEAEEGAALTLNNGELGMNAGDTLNKMTDGLAVWLMPIYEHSSVSGMKSDGFTSGYSTDLGGMALGADYTFDKYRLGLAINAGGGSTTSSGDFNESKNNFDFFGVSLYGGLRHNNFALNADLGYSRINNDISQDMSSASGLGSHSADVNTDVWTMGVNAEYLISTQYVDIIPHAGVRYMNIRTGSHSIDNGGSTLFNVKANSQDVWTFPLGVAFEKEYNLASGWELTPKADVGVVFAAGDLTSRTRASMPGVQSALEMEMQNIDSVAFNGGIGLDMISPSKNTTFSLNYNLQASEHETSHGLQATFRYEF